MSQTPRKPARPTRTPTSRPRRVAGQPRESVEQASYADETEPVAEPEVAEPEVAEPEVAEPVVLDETAPAPVVEEAPYDVDPAGARRPVVGLVVVIVLLLVVGAGELLYLRGVIGGDGDAQQAAPVSEARPVTVPDLEVQRVVDQAATAADLILSASSTDYDAQVDKATATMTEPFAEKYRQTKADIKDQFIAADTSVVIDISAQGVVTASSDEITALVFLTQTTQKGKVGGVKPVQYRVTVTMVNTADGWLVSDLQAL